MNRRIWIFAAVGLALGIGCELVVNLPGGPVIPPVGYTVLRAGSSLTVVMAGVLTATALCDRWLVRLAGRRPGAARAQWLILLVGLGLFVGASVLREVGYSALDWAGFAPAGWVFLVLTSVLWLLQMVGTVMIGLMLVSKLLAGPAAAEPSAGPLTPAPGRFPAGPPRPPGGTSRIGPPR